MSIYQELWDLDSNRLTVAVRTPDGAWDDPDADIYLDEQAVARHGRSDCAPEPLFARVDATKLLTGSNAKLFTLLNNYVVNTKAPEEYTGAEVREIDSFLDDILDTGPMRRARAYLAENLDERFTDEEFRARMWKIWFELYTNHYNRRPVHYCSGFEHVFVGEGKYNRRNEQRMGEIGGYHSWLKFYLDEKYARNVNFLGTQYRLRGKGPGNKVMATMRMTWNHMDLEGNVVYELYKDIGGFFVGISPECQMAIGTVAFFEHKRDRQNKRRVTIDGVTFNLVLYRNTTEHGTNGEHIRSMYPELKNAPNIPGNEIGTIPIGDQVTNDGPVIIASVLPDPVGRDTGSAEYVEVQNNSDAEASLDGWHMGDKMNRKEPLSGVLAPGEKKKFYLPRTTASSMALGNGGGTVYVAMPSGDVVARVAYEKKDVQEGVAIGFVAS